MKEEIYCPLFTQPPPPPPFTINEWFKTYLFEAELSSRILELEIGSAASYAALKPGDTETKMKYRENIKRFSLKLATLSALVNLRYCCHVH